MQNADRRCCGVKIKCTQDEKEQLVMVLSCGIQCPFAETKGHWCDGTMNCRPCVEKVIEWEIEKEGD